VYFLKTCKLNNIVPTHLLHIYKILYSSKHYRTVKKLERIIYNSQMKILSIEIFDIHRSIHSLNKDLMKLLSILSNNLSSHIYYEILKFYSQSHSVITDLDYL